MTETLERNRKLKAATCCMMMNFDLQAYPQTNYSNNGSFFDNGLKRLRKDALQGRRNPIVKFVGIWRIEGKIVTECPCPNPAEEIKIR